MLVEMPHQMVIKMASKYSSESYYVAITTEFSCKYHELRQALKQLEIFHSENTT